MLYFLGKLSNNLFFLSNLQTYPFLISSESAMMFRKVLKLKTNYHEWRLNHCKNLSMKDPV